MERIDWKFVLVLAVHLLAVGVMYGRITSDVSAISIRSLELKSSVDRTREAVEALTGKITVLETQRAEDAKRAIRNETRLDTLEREVWERRAALKGTGI